MKKIINYSLLTFDVVLIAAILKHQPRNNDGGACCAFMGFWLFFSIAMIVLNVALLIWVAKDAKNRGMDSAILWMIFVFFLGPIGLVIYLFTRPQGNVIQCSNCHNKKLQAAVKCPHCGS